MTARVLKVGINWRTYSSVSIIISVILWMDTGSSCAVLSAVDPAPDLSVEGCELKEGFFTDPSLGPNSVLAKCCVWVCAVWGWVLRLWLVSFPSADMPDIIQAQVLAPGQDMDQWWPLITLLLNMSVWACMHVCVVCSIADKSGSVCL